MATVVNQNPAARADAWGGVQTSGSIQIKDVQKYYGTVHALRGVSTSVNKGEVLVLIGPSGCGKSTLLRSINGLEKIDSGRVVVDGKVIDTSHKNINSVRAEV